MTPDLEDIEVPGGPPAYSFALGGDRFVLMPSLWRKISEVR